MTVITREQIDSLPGALIADVLRLAAPIDVRARGSAACRPTLPSAARVSADAGARRRRPPERCADGASQRRHPCAPRHDRANRGDVRAGSSLFGADAFGGTINVITRRPLARRRSPSRGAASGWRRRPRGGWLRAWAALADVRRIRRAFGRVHRRPRFQDRGRYGRGRPSARRQACLFRISRRSSARGNFYGAAATGDAMSREWTSQSLVAADHVFGTAAGWTFSGDALVPHSR